MITLQNANSTLFTTQGLGSLTDITSGVVVEELNGGYELTMEYPITGIHYKDIQLRRIIYCKPNPYSKPQPFRIYSISKPINMIVTINAAHISYDLSGFPVNAFVGTSPKDTMTKLKSNSTVAHDFSFNSTVTTEGEVKVEDPRSTRAVLGNNVLSAYGGEFEFDGFMVYHRQDRGMNRGVSIRYGKNLTDINQEENITDTYTGVYPYWTGYEYNEETGEQGDKKSVYLPEKIVNVEGTFDFTKILTLDLSNEWQDPPTEDELRKKTVDYIVKNEIGIPKISIDISFLQLTRSSEYSQYAILEEVELGDRLEVEFIEAQISATARCIKTTYNIITDKYDTLTLGEAKSNLSVAISDSNKQVNDKLEQQKIHFDAEVGNIKIDLADIEIAVIEKADIEYVNANFAHISNGVIDNATIGDATITTAKIQDAAITTAKIADAAIENAQIANGSIDNAKILDASITGAKIQDASIGTAQIGDAQITVAKIQDAFIDNLVATQGKFESAHIGELTSNNIQAGAITAGKLSANSVKADNIQAGAITADKIATDSITSDKILAGTIVADDLAANSITTDKITTGAVTADKIAADSITTDKIVAGTIIADDLAANSITTDKIQANAITTDKIGANQVTANKIAANSITSDKIQAGSIEADDISAKALDAIAINAGSIVANDIEAGEIKISNANILDGSISGAKITNASITNAQIKDATIESAKIKDLNASKITTGTLDTTKVSVNSTSGNLTIQDNTIQIKDNQSSPKVRVQIGKDATNNYGIVVVNAQGKAIFDSDKGVLISDGLNSNIVSTDKIIDNAVSPSKIQIKELWADTAYINEFNGQTINADNITTGKISGDRIDITGLVNFKALDEDLSKLFVPGSQNGTVINGGFIGTDTIKANSIDLYSGLVVRNESGALSFSIAANGDVEVNGLLKSGNYRPGVSGYQVETNGRAEFNEAVIRGSIDLPNAGLTDSGSAELNPVRIWAGASYENRDLAPFKVLQNGSFIALDGTFTGRVYGNYDNDRIHIHDNEIVIDSVSTFINELGEESKYIPMNATSDNPFIKLSSNQSFINTDLVFGSATDKRIEYFNNDKVLNSNITIIQTNKRGVIESNSTHYFGPNNSENGMNIMKTSNNYGGSHCIKYWDGFSGMIFESTGSSDTPETANEKPYDFKFEKTNSTVNVKIQGNIEVTNSVTSDSQNIEMRSVAGEGWGFYAT